MSRPLSFVSPWRLRSGSRNLLMILDAPRAVARPRPPPAGGSTSTRDDRSARGGASPRASPLDVVALARARHTALSSAAMRSGAPAEPTSFARARRAPGRAPVADAAEAGARTRDPPGPRTSRRGWPHDPEGRDAGLGGTQALRPGRRRRPPPVSVNADPRRRLPLSPRPGRCDEGDGRARSAREAVVAVRRAESPRTSTSRLCRVPKRRSAARGKRRRIPSPRTP